MLKTKRDVAYEFIKDKITGGELRPGQRIVLGEIAGEIGISTLPVREALFQLQHEHMVSITPHVGAMVAIADVPTLIHIIEPLAVLEGYATRLARHAGDLDELLGSLAQINDDMSEQVRRRGWEGFSRANKAFHMAIYDRCDNEVLVESIHALWARLEGLLGLWSFHLIPDRTQGSIAEHGTIIELMRDPATDDTDLELFAREHKLKTGRSFQMEEAMSEDGRGVSMGGD